MKTRKEIEDTALKELQAKGATGDSEVAHINADAILTETLRKLGLNKLADLFDKLSDDYWYA